MNNTYWGMLYLLLAKACTLNIVYYILLFVIRSHNLPARNWVQVVC